MGAGALSLPARRPRRWLDAVAVVLGLGAVAVLLALGISMAAGYRVLIDRGDSMRPAIESGDLVVTKVVRPSEVRAGEIITFSDFSRDGQLVTHRVVSVRADGSRFSFVTRGDANTGVERWSIEEEGTLGGFVLRIPRLGHVVAWFTIPVVRILFVTLGVLALGGIALRRIWAR